jgi:hypothetical protein
MEFRTIQEKIIAFVLMLWSVNSIFAQDDIGGVPYSIQQKLSNENITEVTTPLFDFTPLVSRSAERVKQGTFPITDKIFDVNYNFNAIGTWTQLPNGDRVWRLKITSAGAKKTALYYQNFYLPKGGLLFIYNESGTEILGAYSSLNNESANNNGGIFSTEYISGPTQIIEYYEPAKVKGQAHIEISHVVHQFQTTARNNMIDESDPCEVDVNCSEGANWQDEKKGIVRLYVVEMPGNEAGWCSGSLVNNTAHDCKKYILTAMHCAISETTSQETTDYSLWKAYFNYEKTGCASGTATTSKVLTGAVKRAGADDGGGQTGSDFLLIELTSSTYPTGVTPYYNGWTNLNSAPIGGGVCIHHPHFDCKKISTFTIPPTTISWGSVANTHWNVTWAATANGHGVTEGGSSGSPLFDTSGFIVGTLTGGNSFCTSPNSPDAYGKMSFHWASNGTATSKQLKPWLDPTNSGVASIAGSYCGPQSVSEKSLDDAIRIYPNPGSGLFIVASEFEKPKNIKICVFNVMGQTIENKNFVNAIDTKLQLDLSNQSVGIYFIEINVDGVTAVKKINIIK